MTVLDERQVTTHRQVHVRRRRHRGAAAGRPGPVRPAVAPMRHRGTGIPVSRVPHTGRPVGAAVTLALAGVAALITLWLGSLANLSGPQPEPGRQSADLAVVRVQTGETLQELAGRVAPDAPVGQVVARIRELNKLGSSSVDAGQTLIAPVG